MTFGAPIGNRNSKPIREPNVINVSLALVKCKLALRTLVYTFY